MIQKLLVVLLFAGLSTAAAAETVYKWMDARGQVHYTDLPPRAADARILGVYQGRESLSEGDDAGGEGGATPPAATTPPPTMDPPPSPETVAAVQADVAAVQSEQCKAAQERYKLYIESRRLFRQTPDGQREYLSDRELAEARIRAKQEADEACR